MNDDQKPCADWVARSDAFAWRYLAVMRRFEPEVLSWFGDAGSDAATSDLAEDGKRREAGAYGELAAELEASFDEEADPRVRTDLGVLRERCEKRIAVLRAEDERLVPWVSLPRRIFEGLRPLLDERNEPERRQSACARVRRYAGSEPGTEPITEKLRSLLRAGLGRGALLAPFREAVEKDLRTSGAFLGEIERLLRVFEVAGYERDFARLEGQLRDFEAFCRERVLPVAREDFRLPREVYQAHLAWLGVDMPVEELTSRGKVEFQKTRRELRSLARKAKGGKAGTFAEYRPIIGEVLAKRIAGGRLLAHYEKRLSELRDVLSRHDVLSPEALDVRIVSATAAESALLSAPHVRAPRYLAGGSEPVEMVLPWQPPGREGGAAYDFNAAAATRSTLHHEAAHALAMGAGRRLGLPLLRTLFGSMSEHEGWAVYLESELRPHLPPASRWVSLHRHLRHAAKAFLEPGLHAGTVSLEEAARVLRDDIVLSEATVAAEIERFTFSWPGQASCYLYGYLRETELRAEAELALGREFRVREYHDFLLSQGLLPFRWRRERILAEYVAGSRRPLAA